MRNSDMREYLENLCTKENVETHFLAQLITVGMVKIRGNYGENDMKEIRKQLTS